MTSPEERNSPERLAKPKRLRQQVYETVRDRIKGGVITEEDRIVDLELASELGISRMPVREALMQLVNEGMLESTSRGFVLRTFTDREIAEIFEVRRLLEPAAAASAALTMSIAVLHSLEVAIGQCEKSSKANDVRKFVQYSAEFRTTWLEQVPNTMLTSTITRFADQVQAVRLVTLRHASVRGDAVARMWRLCEAFRAKDPLEAATRTEAQVTAAYEAYRRTRASESEQPVGKPVAA